MCTIIDSLISDLIFRPTTCNPTISKNNRPPSNLQNNTRVPNGRWSQLNNDYRNMWNSLLRETNAIILGLQFQIN